MDIYYTLWVIVQHCIILLPKLFCLWELSRVPESLCRGPRSLLSTFLFSSIARCSRRIFHIPFLSAQISHFSDDLWFLLLENRIRRQDLDTRPRDFEGASSSKTLGF